MQLVLFSQKVIKEKNKSSVSQLLQVLSCFFQKFKPNFVKLCIQVSFSPREIFINLFYFILFGNQTSNAPDDTKMHYNIFVRCHTCKLLLDCRRQLNFKKSRTLYLHSFSQTLFLQLSNLCHSLHLYLFFIFSLGAIHYI